MAVFSPLDSLACRLAPMVSMYVVDICQDGLTRPRLAISPTKWSRMDLSRAEASIRSWGTFSSILLT